MLIPTGESSFSAISDENFFRESSSDNDLDCRTGGVFQERHLSAVETLSTLRDSGSPDARTPKSTSRKEVNLFRELGADIGVIQESPRVRKTPTRLGSGVGVSLPGQRKRKRKSSEVVVEEPVVSSSSFWKQSFSEQNCSVVFFKSCGIGSYTSSSNEKSTTIPQQPSKDEALF